MITIGNLRIEYIQDLKKSGVDLDDLEKWLKDLSALRLDPDVLQAAVLFLGDILTAQDLLELENRKGAARGYSVGVHLRSPCAGLHQFFERAVERVHDQLSAQLC